MRLLLITLFCLVSLSGFAETEYGNLSFRDASVVQNVEMNTLETIYSPVVSAALFESMRTQAVPARGCKGCTIRTKKIGNLTCTEYAILSTNGVAEDHTYDCKNIVPLTAE